MYCGNTSSLILSRRQQKLNCRNSMYATPPPPPPKNKKQINFFKKAQNNQYTCNVNNVSPCFGINEGLKILVIMFSHVLV